MDIMVYVILAYTLILIGMYGWRSYTARQLDAALKELAGLQALGKHQSETSIKIDKHNMKLKEELDAEFTNTINTINSDGVSDSPSTRDLSRPLEQLSRSELQRRLMKAEAALDTIYKWKSRVQR